MEMCEIPTLKVISYELVNDSFSIFSTVQLIAHGALHVEKLFFFVDNDDQRDGLETVQTPLCYNNHIL